MYTPSVCMHLASVRRTGHRNGLGSQSLCAPAELRRPIQGRIKVATQEEDTNEVFEDPQAAPIFRQS